MSCQVLLENLPQMGENGRVKGSLATWLEGEWLKWQAKEGRRKSQRLFAKWLEVPEGTLTHWISGSRRKLDDPSVRLLAAKLGPEIYDVLGQPRPDPRLQALIDAWGRLPEATKDELAARVDQYMGAEQAATDGKATKTRSRVGKAK